MVRKNIGAEYITADSQLGKRWQLIKGKSGEEIPRYFETHKEKLCDLIHVDGSHTREGVFSDLTFMQIRANKDHIVLVDDVQFPTIQLGILDAGEFLTSICCYKTRSRDLSFVGRRASVHAKKIWCRMTFNVSWIPSGAFKQRFASVTGYDISDELYDLKRQLFSSVDTNQLQEVPLRGALLISGSSDLSEEYEVANVLIWFSATILLVGLVARTFACARKRSGLTPKEKTLALPSRNW